MHLSRLVLGSWVSAAIAALPAAQEIVPLVTAGEVLPGAPGPVSSVLDATLGPTGEWYLDFFANASGSPRTLVHLGQVALQPGDPVPGLAGHTVGSFTLPRPNAAGSVARSLGWFDPQGFGGRGLFIDDTLLVQDGDPVLGASAPATHVSFLVPRVDDAGDLLFVASGLGTALPNYRALTVVEDAASAEPTWTILHENGDVLPGQTATLTGFLASSWSDSAWRGGRVLWAGDLSDGSVAVYRTDAATGAATLLAQEGGPSPHPGRPWKHLQSPRLDLNTSGDWVLHGHLELSPATNEVIVKNGVIAYQEGFGHPAIPVGMTFVDFGTGPLDLDEAGDLLWFGRWNDPNPAVSSGLFLNDVLIVQQGVTQVDGQTITFLDTNSSAYALSDDGRFVTFQAGLSDGTFGVFLLDLEPAASYCVAKATSLGCVPQIGSRGVASEASTIDFEIDCVDVLNQKPGLLFFGFAPAGLPFNGGTLCVQPPLARTPVQTSGGNPPPTDCSGSYSIDFNALIQAGAYPQLAAGNGVFAQWWMRDPQNGAGNLGTALSEGLTTIIAP